MSKKNCSAVIKSDFKCWILTIVIPICFSSHGWQVEYPTIKVESLTKSRLSHFASLAFPLSGFFASGGYLILSKQVIRSLGLDTIDLPQDYIVFFWNKSLARVGVWIFLMQKCNAISLRHMTIEHYAPGINRKTDNFLYGKWKWQSSKLTRFRYIKDDPWAII